MKRKRGLLFRLTGAVRSALIRVYIHGALIHRASANACSGICRKLIRFSIDIKALPLVWMDESTAHVKGLLRHSSKGITYEPHFIGRAQATKIVYLSEIYYYVFEKARVSVISSSVILNDKQVIIERVIGPDQSKFDFSSGHIIAHGGDTAVIRFDKSEGIRF